MDRRTDRQSRRPSRADQPRRRNRWIISAAASGAIAGLCGFGALLTAEPHTTHADDVDIVNAAPATGIVHAPSPAPVRQNRRSSKAQGGAQHVTVTVQPGEGANLSTQAAPVAPRRPQGGDPNATVDDAFSLFKAAAASKPAMPGEPTITPNSTTPALKSTKTIKPLKTTRTFGGKPSPAKVEAKPRIEPAPAAARSMDQWTINLGGYDTREAAAEAAASAHYHLMHGKGEINVSPFVAVDDHADEAARYVALLSGFDAESDAEIHAEFLVQYGYRGRPLLVDFSSSLRDESHE